MKRLDLREAFPAVPERFEKRIHTTMMNMEDLSMKTKHKAKLSLVVVLVLVVLVSAALAAAQWGVLDFLTYRGKDGNAVGMDYLAPMVTPVEQTHQGDGFSVSVQDLLCDGASLSLAWTYTNAASQEPLFFYYDLVLEDGAHRAENLMSGMGGTALQLQGTAQEAGLWRLDPILEDGASLPVVLKIDVLKSKVPVEYKDLPDSVASQMTDAEHEANYAQSQKIMREGKLLVENGVAATPRMTDEVWGALTSGEISQSQAMIEMGLMERVDGFELKIPVTVRNERKSALPEGQPIEKQMDGYTMRVTRADLYPSATYLDLEYVFDSRAEMLAFAKGRSGWLGREEGEDVVLGWVGCYAATYEEARQNGTDDHGDNPIDGFTMNTKDVHQREDGKWVMPMHQHSAPLRSAVKVITLVPFAYEWISSTETCEFVYWEDAITLHFGE